MPKELVITKGWNGAMPKTVNSKDGNFIASWNPIQEYYSIAVSLGQKQTKVMGYYSFITCHQRYAFVFEDNIKGTTITTKMLKELAQLCDKCNEKFPRLTRANK